MITLKDWEEFNKFRNELLEKRFVEEFEIEKKFIEKLKPKEKRFLFWKYLVYPSSYMLINYEIARKFALSMLSPIVPDKTLEACLDWKLHKGNNKGNNKGDNK